MPQILGGLYWPGGLTSPLSPEEEERKEMRGAETLLCRIIGEIDLSVFGVIRAHPQKAQETGGGWWPGT